MSEVNNAGAVPPQIAQGLEAVAQHIEGATPSNQPSNPVGGAAAPQAVPGAPGQAVPAFWEKMGYSSPELLERSVSALRSGYSDKADEATRLQQENEALKAQMAGRQNPSGFPQGYAPNQPDPFDELEKTYGVPRDLLGRGLESMVESKLNTVLSPFVKAAEAEQKAVERYGPEYSRIKPAIDSFVATHPDIANMVNAARQGGMAELANDYALAKFREAYYTEQHNQITGAAGATGSAVANARSHAGVLTGRGEETRVQANGGTPSQIDRAEAIARMNAGDDRMFNQKATELLVPWSEEYLQGVMNGRIFLPGQI